MNRRLAYYAVIGCTACSHETITRYPETSLSFWNGGCKEDARCGMDSTNETHQIATLSRERCSTIFRLGTQTQELRWFRRGNTASTQAVPQNIMSQAVLQKVSWHSPKRKFCRNWQVEPKCNQPSSYLILDASGTGDFVGDSRGVKASVRNTESNSGVPVLR